MKSGQRVFSVQGVQRQNHRYFFVHADSDLNSSLSKRFEYEVESVFRFNRALQIEFRTQPSIAYEDLAFGSL